MGNTPVKFLVLSDTHNFDESADLCPLKHPMPAVDVVLHCGDLTSVGGASSYKKALRLLGSFDAQLKIVIAGNHDLDLDGHYWRAHLDGDDKLEDHDNAIALMTGSEARANNITYLTEGPHTFTLRSGKSFKIFVSPYTPEFNDWAFGYKRGETRWNIPDDVDIVMTHGPPFKVLDYSSVAKKHLGCETLLKEVERVKPLMHCFGHIHDGYGIAHHPLSWWSVEGDMAVAVSQAGTSKPRRELRIKRGESMLMVNAAVMNEDYQPKNAPWVIELPL
ncbi:Putative calcineurin-like phosphoesterase domain, ApaH type, metallo-dependent phosphatase [Septoria linicola]|uniref:Calcineurin-like phosphoesterase domain, ApaH type, metallo-dependent phosphatase n=1 Tax=Septoria linicola TaxID=215465 RepID=A0A9Q9EH50_9PEZI|nr:putative calcineurin-like phosphoesterase domain, ApaH type, metallo-dependent phosphatase [Septoria linicola]USW49619.1 Putative calcineurin-like phosphoesterase domain, ApaH type, metallo-dependent phosphatase [Septoria linicola]